MPPPPPPTISLGGLRFALLALLAASRRGRCCCRAQGDASDAVVTATTSSDGGGYDDPLFSVENGLLRCDPAFALPPMEWKDWIRARHDPAAFYTAEVRGCVVRVCVCPPRRPRAARVLATT